MTTRRKFLTTAGILAGIGIFGKLFSKGEENDILPKEAEHNKPKLKAVWNETKPDLTEMSFSLHGGVERIYVVNSDTKEIVRVIENQKWETLEQKAV